MEAYFESVPRDGSCAYCSGRRPVTPLPAPVDAVYCISLQEQNDRTQRAIEHFHEIGLCRHVILYRPLRGAYPERAIWQSHRAVAQHAMAGGCRSALLLEDDIAFRKSWDALAPKIARAIAALPETWWGLFLGHLPLQAYFVRANILRVRSVCMPACSANTCMLTWLATTEPMGAEVPT